MDALKKREESWKICENLSVNENGVLCLNGYSMSKLAEKYGTPLYVMDEERIRNNVRLTNAALKESFGSQAQLLYASKACDFKRMYAIMQEEGIGADVVSGGEIVTAYHAGFSMENVYFHGNSKTDEEIELAIRYGVGCLVIDNPEEALALEKVAEKNGILQKVLIRITPGIDPHTFEAVATGKVDSKFGCAIETGAAEAITALVLTQPHLRLAGYHCHVGSQIFDSEVFMRAGEILLQFIDRMQKRFHWSAEELNLGGGFGVRYRKADPAIQTAAVILQLGAQLKQISRKLNLRLPKILLEPGRSLVADAGLTLYRVGSVKHIEGYKSYVSVNGGMSDNPRYALYKAPYTVVCADKMNERPAMVCSVVGKCCESGDILQENVLLPDSVRRNDLIAVLTTGAYNYSMASGYNRLLRPAVVMLTKEKDYLAVKRQTEEDLLRNEL